MLRFGITKVTTRPELFPCAKFIGWILLKVDPTGMLMNNTENKAFASFTPTFLPAAYTLPKKEASLTT